MRDREQWIVVPLGFDLSPFTAITDDDRLAAFHENRTRGLLPDLSDPFTKYLYSTFVSFYGTRDLAYPVDLKTDDRGWLFELIKSPAAGQIFVSRTKPGITRGNHYHDTKLEKFCVIQGEAVIRFRHSRTEVRQRTWERGAGETLACGTGASAVCVAGVLNGLTEKRILNHLSGGDLELEWAEDGYLYMTGPAVEVFSGEIAL